MHAQDLKDAEWAASMYNGLLFRRNRWILPYTPAQANAVKVRSSAFQRFPITFVRAGLQNDTDGERVSGVSYMADLRHAGTGPPGIAHFAKRVLRLHGLQQQAARYGLPPVDHVVFPATTARQLLQAWPRAMLKLVALQAKAVPADELTRRNWHFEHVVVSARENTYFSRPEDADLLRAKAYALAGIAPQRRPCARVNACYFRRAEGLSSSTGAWEGGPRIVANGRLVVRLMQLLVNVYAPGGRVTVVGTNSSMSFEQQVSVFASCDMVVSVHGSHNANVMFMRAGSAFMEVNPYKFFYASYEALAGVCGLLYLPSRFNSIAVGTMRRRDVQQAEAFTKKYGSW